MRRYTPDLKRTVQVGTHQSWKTPAPIRTNEKMKLGCFSVNEQLQGCTRRLQDQLLDFVPDKDESRWALEEFSLLPQALLPRGAR